MQHRSSVLSGQHASGVMAHHPYNFFCSYSSKGDPDDPSNHDNITEFTLHADGTPTQIPHSTRPLSAPQTDPAQMGFNKAGTVLLVTEKAPDTITTYTYVLDADAIPSEPLPRPSAMPTPFGFQFGDRHVVYISNPASPGAVASYQINRETGEVSSTVDGLSTENATCWVVLSNDQTMGYATNAGSASLSPVRILFDGTTAPLA